MRVSLINSNLVAQDAIGRTLLDQARFFRRRGDEVRIYVMYPLQEVPEDVAALTRVVNLADLVVRGDSYFDRSDLYIYHYPGHYPLMGSIKKIDRGAVIFYYHNVTPPELWGDSPEQKNLQRSLDSIGLFTHYADLTVTDSPFNADQLVREYSCERDRIRVLPQAVALDKFAPGPRDMDLLRKYGLEGRRVILFVGRMAGNKRIDLLVEALPLVQQKVPQAVLMLVGDDRSNQDFREVVSRARALASKRGVAKDVIFTGMVDDLSSYYRLADVYATASLHEGFGVPLIEAMASGLPVVASRATAHPWVVGEAGLLVEPGDVTDLADKIARVLTDDRLCGELVQSGLARAREFSLEYYETQWARIVAEATAWLPDQPYPLPRSLLVESAPLSSEAKLEKLTPAVQEALLRGELQQLEASADVMLRDYVVRSRLPLVGSLIVWIRRNLTSHLREPYLDPILERQVVFNWQTVESLKQAHALWKAVLAREPQQMETRIAGLEAEVKQLREQITQLIENQSKGREV
jgi:glycosyltransferase involved in cell wall biosynthesis